MRVRCPVTEADWDRWLLAQPDAPVRYWYLYYLATVNK